MYLKKIFVLFITLLTILLLVSACAPNQDGAELPPSEPATGDGEDLPPIDYPPKGNPKLDSHLWQLIEAEKRGGAESLARSWGRGDDVVDGKVKVIIESFPGQVQVAADSATKVGAIQVRVRSEENLIKALVPITKLTALAEAGSIRFIGLPVRAETE